MWCLKNICFGLTGKWKEGAPRESVSQSFVVLLSTGPIESRSDQGHGRLHPIDWERPDVKAGIGICCYWQKGDLSDT